ncbi:MAG TPA: hypothetical protein VM487_04730 [Phycisphaerae bacterium]|nr:hypothetical protein [Phycisphaerae bacterium]
MKRLSPDAEKWFFDKCRNSGDRREFLKFIRYKCLTDLPFFAQAVLDYKDCTDSWHYYLAERFECRTKPHLFVSGGRGSYKSSLGNCAQAMQRWLRDPSTTMLMYGADEGVALGHCNEIAGKFESPKFRAVWGDVRDKPWAPSQGVLNTRGQRFRSKDPTVGVGSPEMEWTSKHPRLMIVDDLEGELNSRSTIKREKAIECFKDLWGLIHRDQEVWVFNSPQHHDFIVFGLIMNPATKFYRFFDIVFVPIGDIGEPSLVMPEMYTPARIEELETIWGRAGVMCQLYLWPVGEDYETFDMSLLDKNVIDELPRRVNRWCIVDPSKSKKHGHDPLGMVALGKDVDQNLIVLDCDEVHKSPWECCRAICRFAERSRCRGISVELAPGVTDYRELLRDFLKDAGTPDKFVLHTVTAGNREKHAERIDPLIMMWERGKLKVYAGMPPEHYRLFVRQMRAYPVGRDDLLDCTGYHTDVRRFRFPKAADKPMSEAEAEKRKMLKDELVFADEWLGEPGDRSKMETIGGLPPGY